MARIEQGILEPFSGKVGEVITGSQTPYNNAVSYMMKNALALTCAYNAVIVGDTLQLPNVITDEDKAKLTAIMSQYHIAEGYDCSKNSFLLQSVLEVVKDVPETLLREHYRCHPRIINEK